MSQLTFAKIDQTILDTLTPPKKYYWLILFFLLVGVMIGAACWTYQIFVGIGVGGQNNPVGWGTYLINFVFWVGIAHSGTLISAILHLFRAGWRNPIARAAETMTVFAVCIAGLYPFIHLGRLWQVYYMIPLPNQRLLWPNFLSPLMFDVIAISTYLTVSSLFFCRPGHPAGHLSAQCRLLGFRPWHRPRLAHDHFCPLLCGRGHPFRPGHGADPDDSTAQNI
jgi:molybdopterin-containing oxidoreductase family membrane subunit